MNLKSSEDCYDNRVNGIAWFNRWYMRYSTVGLQFKTLVGAYIKGQVSLKILQILQTDSDTCDEVYKRSF